MEPQDHARGADSETEWPPGWQVRHVAETGSTNADLIAVAGSTPDRSVLFADHQTAGRGRLDRRWDAPAGANLLVSMLFRESVHSPHDLTRRVGLAAVEAVAHVAQVDAVLKWPNDVLLDERKLAGILAQQAGSGAVVVGMGLNIGWAPAGAARLGGDLRPVQVLAEVLRAFDALPADVGDRYRSVLATIGRRVRVELPAGELYGTAVDVDPDGRLVVIDDCAVSHRLDVGDVVHVRPT